MTTIIVNGKRKKVTTFQRNAYVSFRIVYGLSLIAISLFLAWFVVSYFNVVANNLNSESAKNIWDWNFFNVVVDVAKKLGRLG